MNLSSSRCVCIIENGESPKQAERGEIEIAGHGRTVPGIDDLRTMDSRIVELQTIADRSDEKRDGRTHTPMFFRKSTR